MTLFSQEGVWEVESLREGKQQGDNYEMNDRNILLFGVFLIN